MRTCLACGFVLTLAFSVARAGESLSPEALLPGHETTDAYRPVAAFGPSSPEGSAAAGKGVYLVVWEAGRNEAADIVGLRLDKAGRPLDAKPFVICAAEGCQERPRVAFGGGVFLVVWQDLRNNKDYDVRSARVSPEGKVLDAEGFAVSAEKGNQCQPAVCFDGRAFQIVWRDFRDGKNYALYGGRLGPSGECLDGSGVLVHEPHDRFGFKSMGVPGAGSDAKGVVVVGYHAPSTGLILLVLKDGRSQGKPKNLPGGRGKDGWDPLFASDGQKLLSVFTTDRPASRGGVAPNSGALLLEPGDVAKGGKFDKPIKLSSAKSWASALRRPCAAWDGQSYVVAWDDAIRPSGPGAYKRSNYAAVSWRRLTRNGEPQGEDAPVAGELANPARHAAVASGGAGTTLIAYEKHPAKGDVPIKIGFRLLRAK